MKKKFEKFDTSVENSILGLDYPEGKVTDSPIRKGWMTDPRYRPYLKEWVKRWEYHDRILREVKDLDFSE